MLLKQKINLKKDIKNLNKNEYIEIFKIILNNNIKYTENNNGIFINLKYVNEQVMEKLLNFIEFSKINKKKFKKIENVRLLEKNKSKQKDNFLSQDFLKKNTLNPIDNYLKKYIVFSSAFIILIIAEILLKYSGFSALNSFSYFLAPIILFIILYSILIKNILFEKRT